MHTEGLGFWFPVLLNTQNQDGGLSCIPVPSTYVLVFDDVRQKQTRSYFGGIFNSQARLPFHDCRLRLDFI